MFVYNIVVIFTVVVAVALMHPPTSVRLWNGLMRSLIAVIDWIITELMTVTKEGMARATSPEFFSAMSAFARRLRGQGLSDEEIRSAAARRIALALAEESEIEVLDVAQKFADKHRAEIDSVFAKYGEWLTDQAT